MNDAIASEMLAQLAEALTHQDIGDQGATVVEADEEQPRPVVRAPRDVDGYILHGRRPLGAPQHVWLTWQDRDLSMASDVRAW